MAVCDPECVLGCETGCQCPPQTATDYKLLAAITETATEIVVSGEAPCCGYILAKSCSTGDAEIMRIITSNYETSNDTSVITVERGLAFSGCDQSGNNSLRKCFNINDKVVVGSNEIHYYYCNLCKEIECIKNEIRCIVDDVEDLQTVDDPDDPLRCGERCIVRNADNGLGSSCYAMYVYDCDENGENGMWQKLGCDFDPCTFKFEDGLVKALHPQADVVSIQRSYATFLRVGPGDIIDLNNDESEITITVPDVGCRGALVRVLWEVDPDRDFPNNPAAVTIEQNTAAIKFNVFRDGTLVRADAHNRQYTNYGEGDGAQWTDDDQTTLFIEEVLAPGTYTYYLQVEYIAATPQFTNTLLLDTYTMSASYLTLAE